MQFSPKHDTIQQFAAAQEVDALLTTENNVAWTHIPAGHQLCKCNKGWWEALHITMAHNQTDSDTNPYQPGGVTVLSINKATHQISGAGKDSQAPGWFCWTIYHSIQNRTLLLVVAYWP